MGSHPINLVFRFILELCAFTAIGLWGWKQSDGLFRYVLAIGIPLLLTTIWGVFAVPNDPSRSGSAPVKVSGIVRLIVELAIFAFAIWALQDAYFIKSSWTLAITVALHYIISYDRIIWLIKQ
ncbi:MAG: YrdB family protein [Gilvibacter sp.]